MRPVYAVIIALMVTALTAAAMWQSYRLGRAGAAHDAAEQQLGEYSRALRESSAVISDASAVLHEVMTQRQQRAQEGETRREQLRKITATDECARALPDARFTDRLREHAERAAARAGLPVHSGGTDGGHTSAALP